MSYTNGLTYKPIMDKELRTLLDNGALVHMLEFKTNHLAFGKDELFDNACNAFTGRDTGKCSSLREAGFYDNEMKSLKAMATTAVVSGCPIKLFDDFADVGFLMDRNKAELVFVSHIDAMSILTQGGSVEFTPNKDKKIHDVNEGKGGNFYKSENVFQVPISRSERDTKNLSEYFENKFLTRYKDMAKKGLFTNIKEELVDVIKLNEVCVNFPTSAVKAVVIYSHEFDDPQKYKSSLHESLFSSENILRGPMLANLVVETIKQKGGPELPVIHYDVKPRKLTINQVQLEQKKVIDVLKRDGISQEFYAQTLGEEHLQNMLLGKTGVEIY